MAALRTFGVPRVQYGNMAENFGVEKSSPPLREIVRKRHALWWTGGVVLTALVVVVLSVMLWKIPKRQVAYVNSLDPKERFDRENEARKTLATTIGTLATTMGGIVLLVGAYSAWRNIKLTQESVATAQKALMVSEEGQITDRFTKAIEQLGAVDTSGKKKLEVRLGGIYALERIAHESERDHWPIMEVLCTYVRVNAPRKLQKSTQTNQASAQLPPLAADIQAILTVLGRGDQKCERKDQLLDLSLTDLSGAFLSGAYLRGADLREADLREADLSGADLSGADFINANLRGACLIRANLSVANLSWAEGLTQEQVDTANGNSATRLPSNLHMPESWKK